MAPSPKRSLLADIDILALAGGLGTRLDGVLGDLPKVMAPIAGQPFLSYLIEWLAAQGAERVILSLGFRADQVLE